MDASLELRFTWHNGVCVFHEHCRPFVAGDQQSDPFDRRKHSTTLNNKLSVQNALCVRTEWQVTLEQEANSVHTIPGGNVSELKHELSTLEKALFCCSKKTVGKRISDSKWGFAFYKRWSRESHIVPPSALVAAGVTVWHETWKKIDCWEECFRDPLFHISEFTFSKCSHR